VNEIERMKKTKIYFDTNQLYYIRKIADESEGSDFGNYKWAYSHFRNNPDCIQDIRALCYIVGLQYEWDLDFYSSDASSAELNLSRGRRALATREAWILFVEGLKEDRQLRIVHFLPDWPVSGPLSLSFIEDKDDRVILRHFAVSGADVLLTDDEDILKNKARLAAMNLHVMRPYEWLSDFVGDMSINGNVVDWLERILFSIGPSMEGMV
jgi:hypothetical protein